MYALKKFTIERESRSIILYLKNKPEYQAVVNFLKALNTCYAMRDTTQPLCYKCRTSPKTFAIQILDNERCKNPFEGITQFFENMRLNEIFSITAITRCLQQIPAYSHATAPTISHR